MNFKPWLLSEEIFPQNNTATVYHRTKSVDSVSSMLTQGYQTFPFSCMYGCGLYTTFDLNSQFTNHMNKYGKYITKWKVTGLDKYLIFQLQVAKSIHKEDFSISNQLKKLNLLNQFQQYYGSEELKWWDSQQEKINFSGSFAKSFYDQNEWIPTSGIKGIIYRSQNDGYCLVKYDPVEDSTINLLGFAEADANDYNKKNELENNQGWITSTNKASFKSIRANPDSEKRKEFELSNKNISN